MLSGRKPGQVAIRLVPGDPHVPQTPGPYRHRRLGLWIRTEGHGGILNIQLSATDARRDHYIPLENRGWTFVVLDPPEDGRFFDYSWPYPFTDLMYTCANVYRDVKQCHLYFNGLPAGAKAACWIGRIEAIEERGLPLVSPALESGGGRIIFPVSLKPDEYLEVDWTGRARHFDPDGALLRRSFLKARYGLHRARTACGSPARSAMQLHPGLKSRSPPADSP